MNVRIIVADERQVDFFDAVGSNSPWQARGSMLNPIAGRKDRDLETDREGRRFGGTAGGTAQSHHGVDGERSTARHELTLFAKDVAQRIEKSRIQHEFDKLILIAAPRMLGLLRQELPAQCQELLAAQVPKDLLHQGQEALREAVPREAFSQLG